VPTLSRIDDVAMLDLGDDENRFSPQWLAELRALVGELAATPPPLALITTARGKFFSNGLDLDWLGQHPDQLNSYVSDVQHLLADILTLPMPTVAAIQGHAFAAGAMLALAHDWRVMRADRGFFCLPEVDIGLPFSTGMDALIRAKLSPAAVVDAMFTGKRYGGLDAAAAGIVMAAVDESQVRDYAITHVAPLAGKAGTALGTIKSTAFASVVEALLAPR
jgi:enoyl-CoA hydratase/carnithine racemase